MSSVGLGSKRLSEAGFSGVGWAGEAWASGTVLASAGQGFGRLTITISYNIDHADVAFKSPGPFLLLDSLQDLLRLA